MNLVKRLEKRWLSLPWPAKTKRRLIKAKFRGLVAEYSVEGRAYHNLLHIWECLIEFDKVRHLAENQLTLELAIWYHDIIYHSKAKPNENEGQSAARAAFDLIQLGFELSELYPVGYAILSTCHGKFLRYKGDCALMHDIDLTIFAKPRARVDEYEAGIWEEYSWVEDKAAGRKLRAGILRRFLRRKSVYLTPFFRSRYNWRAKANLVRLIRKNS